MRINSRNISIAACFSWREKYEKALASAKTFWAKAHKNWGLHSPPG